MAAGGDVAQVVVVAVRAGDHVAAVFEGGIGDDQHVGDADGAEGARFGAEPVDDFGGEGLADFGGAEGGGEFGFAELVVAAEHGEDGFAVGHHDQAFHL